MRELTPENTIIEIFDDETNTVHQFHVRQPTTSERVKYATTTIGKQGEEFIRALIKIQQELGEAITTGFSEGTITLQGVPISTIEGHENYREDWKAILRDAWPQAFEAVAALMFRGPRMARRMEEAVKGDRPPLAN